MESEKENWEEELIQAWHENRPDDIIRTVKRLLTTERERAQKEERERLRAKVWATLDDTGEVMSGGAGFILKALSQHPDTTNN